MYTKIFAHETMEIKIEKMLQIAWEKIKYIIESEVHTNTEIDTVVPVVDTGFW